MWERVRVGIRDKARVRFSARLRVEVRFRF